MAENIGEATVRISADITPLQQAVAKVKATTNELKGMEGFKVNWGEGTGSLQEYDEWLTKTNADMKDMSTGAITADEALRRAGVTARETATNMATVAQASEVVNEKTSKLHGTLSTLGTALAHPIDTIRGAFGKLKNDVDGVTQGIGKSIDDTTKRMTKTKRAFMTWSVVIGATFGQAFTKLSEFDTATKDKLESLKSNWDRLWANIGSVLSPVLDMINVVISAVADLVGWIGSLFGATVNYSEKTEDLNKRLKEQKENEEDLTKATEEYQSAMADVGKQIAKINEQIAESTKEYRRSLKKILVEHETTVATLTQQIRDANDEYQKAVDERNASFAVSQAKEAEEHQKKVDELMTQINFLQRYNNRYNQEKLSQLQFALAKENRLYKQRTEAERAELELQNENDRIARDKKLEEYQKELDEEVALLNKHRELLNGVRNEILLDEVESLTEQYEKQQKSYQEQIAEAGKSGALAAKNWADSYAQYLNEDKRIAEAYSKAGAKGADAFKEKIRQDMLADTGWIGEISRAMDNMFYQIGGGGQMSDKGRAYLAERDRLRQWMHDQGYEGYALGGYTGAGDRNEIAGVVHRGEYVLPQEQVDQTTGQPKLGNTNITINLSGTFATSEAEKRSVAQQIANALQQVQRQRLGA